ncbi:MAG TPA: hypothetical protein VN238_05515 [Solirubrobacteraceae bacterium]|nr:hypothetical protein [Solirubrobacteraceae bacterium]
MADFLEEKKSEISARLDELRPHVEEFRKLEAALDALEGVNAQGTGGGSRRGSGGGGGGRSGGSGGGGGNGGGGGGGRRGRPRGSGTRANEALELVRSKPGITIPEMAQEMGIQQNYLYRVLPSLEEEGQVHKDGRGWFPKEAA